MLTNNPSFNPIHISSHSSTSTPSSSYFDITCPYCKTKNISITSISPHPTTKSYSILIYCPICNTYKSYELQTYYTYLTQNTNHHKSLYKCFKHSTINSSIYCKNCNMHMCNICYSYHSVFEPNHLIMVNRSSYDSNNNNTADTPICDKHCEQNLDFYCENCNMNVCYECGHRQHRGHNVIQLREYWEKVNNDLLFKNIDEISNYFDKEIKNYDCFINEQVYNLEKVILYFQNLKILIEKNHIAKMKNNKMLYKVIESLFEEFFQCKYCPRFNAIQNVERIKIGVFIDKQEYTMFVKGMNCLKNDFDYLAKIHSNIYKKLLFTQVDIGKRELNDVEKKKKYSLVGCSSSNNNNIDQEKLLGKKQQREGGVNGVNTIEENFSTNDTTTVVNDNNIGSNSGNNNNNGMHYEQKVHSKKVKLRINTGRNNNNNNEQYHHSSKEFILNNVPINFSKDTNNCEISVKESKEGKNSKKDNKGDNGNKNNKHNKPQPKVFTFDPVVCEKYLNSLYANLRDENINSSERKFDNNNNTSRLLFDSIHSDCDDIYKKEEQIENNNGVQLDKIENNVLFQRIQQYKTNNQHQHKTPD